MNRLALASVLALSALAGCRSAFAPPATARLGTAPQPQHAATLTRESPLRSAPHASARVLDTAAAGTAVTASDEVVRGFRRVKTADGKSGYVAQEAVEISAGAAAAPAEPTQAQPSAEPSDPAAQPAPAPAQGSASSGQ